MPKVTFLPSERVASANDGDALLDVAIHAEEFITATCGGKGVCGKCTCQVVEGHVETEETDLLTPEQVADNQVLACRARVDGDVTVRLPEVADRFKATLVESSEVVTGALAAIDRPTPLAYARAVELTPPSLDDPVGDFERIKRALAQTGDGDLLATFEVLNELSGATRQCGWKARAVIADRGSVKELLRVHPCTEDKPELGLAIDLGTTTVVGYLVELATGKVLATASGLNRQIAVGDDVITRINFGKRPGGLDRLHSFAIETINDVIDVLVEKAGVAATDIYAASVAGNTVMTHLLLKLDPQNLWREPYVPVATDLPSVPAGRIGLAIHPRAAVLVAPCNAAYVGGDITAGVLYTGFHREDGVTLFVDVGTNGEIVLGGKDFLMTAACSAGPAFEGGGIRHGMRAVPGAIDDVTIDPETFAPTFTTIGGKKPRGICGSGLVDLLSALFLTGMLDGRGKFNDGLPEDRVRDGYFGKEYLIVPADKAVTTEDIVLSETDIEYLMRSKAAVYGGVQCLLKQSGLPLEAIEHILIAGGFGKHLKIRHLIDIGMFPDIDPSMYRYVGNSSLAGAYMTLMSADFRNEIRAIARNMTYIDFSSSTVFFDEYQSAQFLPHTDANQFPTVVQRKNEKGANQ